MSAPAFPPGELPAAPCVAPYNNSTACLQSTPQSLPRGTTSVSSPSETRRAQARAIWQAAVAAARPETLLREAFRDPALAELLRAAPRILVVGAGKAGSAMSTAVEAARPDCLDRIEGVVNVPAGSETPLQRIQLHAARPAGSNHPTVEGVAGAHRILDLLRGAGPQDMALCLLSGGGSALLPAPAAGITLEDKQQVTRLLHACGATINEMNAVRKHLSAIKGGRLAQAFAGRALVSLIISDVIGDPLDVIASGPTAADPTTFGEALDILERFHLAERVPPAVREHLQRGAAGELPETLKALPGNVRNVVIGNNVRSLRAAQQQAEQLGFRVLNLGSYIEGETRQTAVVFAGLVRSLRADGWPVAPPVCVLSGGETTVTLTEHHGLGGRNQEFVLAALNKLGAAGMHGVVLLSGGTDGEDGPT
ncbi:MAG: DUF4147 domain-containing protein, partial [Planctomycetia bacterium]|nr:DUF4147 domain-containing protein [Planctomycetia bacterium]